MRILLINDYGRSAGGAEIITLGLRDELRKRGHDARLFASSAKTSELEEGADFSCLGTTGRLRTLLQCANFPARSALSRVLSEFCPDVVHVNLYLTQLSPLILPLLRDVPTVYYAQWYRAICPLGTKRLPAGGACQDAAGVACLQNGCLPFHDWLPLQAQRLLDGIGRSAFRKITAISGATAAQLARFGGAEFQNLEVIHAGTPEAEPRERMRDTPLIFFAGRLVREKGCHVLLEAFSKVLPKYPNARLIVAGDGPELPRLRKQAADLRILANVEFKGSCSNAETRALMRDAWALCVPSLWSEPFGLVAAEAQMSGVAVVASSEGGLSEIIHHGETGWLVPSGNADSLAHAIQDVFKDPSATLKMGFVGHKNAMDRFSLPAFATRWERLYASIARSEK
jgi:glycosyltransferase involved in cell wall biosynthesis